MVTFARIHALFASAIAAFANRNEIGAIGADGTRGRCPKEHSFALKLRGQSRKRVISTVFEGVCHA
jgi:hypothetical protein